MARQTAMKTIVTEIDGEFTDLQLAERIKRLKDDKQAAHDGLKNAEQQLADRLIERGVTEAEIGDEVWSITEQALTEFALAGLTKLGECTTDEQRLLVIKQLPSGKQLKELSSIAGASAKAVIESAKQKIMTGKTLLKCKKPKKKRVSVYSRKGGITEEGEDSTL